MTLRTWILGLVTISCTAAQGVVGLDGGIEISAGNVNARPAGPFDRIEKMFGGAVFDPAAQHLLSALDSMAMRLFHIEDAKLERYATYRNEDGDCILAAWRFGGVNTVLVDDTPYKSVYAFRLVAKQQVGADGLETFLGKLIRFRVAPLNLNFSALRIQASPTAANILSFFGRNMRSANVLLNMNISGGTDGRSWFLTFSVPRNMEGALSDEDLYIPERFPTLSDLLKTWSFDHIWSEVGKRSVSQFSSTWGRDRDRLLIMEFARRGLTQEQFVALLVDKDVVNLEDRLLTVRAAFFEAHAESTYDRYGAAALHRYAGIGDRADAAANSYFWGNCTTGLESLAKATLKEHIYWKGPLYQITNCSTSWDDLRMLEATTAPNAVAADWKMAVDRMRRRLSEPRQ